MSDYRRVSSGIASRMPANLAAAYTAPYACDSFADALAIGIYLCDRLGRVTQYNRKAAELWGCTPQCALAPLYSGARKTFRLDGTAMPLSETPVAEALRTSRPVRERECLIERPDGSRAFVCANAEPLFDDDGDVAGVVNCIQDITDRKAAEQRQRLLIDELNHRVRNTLATVQSLIAQSARGSETVADFRQRLEARLMALSRAHDELSRRNWADVDLHEVVEAGLGLNRGRSNVTVEGAAVAIGPRAGLMLTMVVHELAANAARYGALSGAPDAQGAVELTWKVEMNGVGAVLRLRWQERGGPPVRPPERRGFGTLLVERGIAAELHGKTTISYTPAGVQCDLEMPLRHGE
jgi:two-component sensor histidine kinase